MVQMKVLAFFDAVVEIDTFISHMVQMKEGKITTDNCSHPELYIPHGSDESRLESGRNGDNTPLYPTWFR